MAFDRAYSATGLKRRCWVSRSQHRLFTAVRQIKDQSGAQQTRRSFGLVPTRAIS
jgi:hypothetical protein